MSLVNQNWIGLNGEPVTGRIPPRLLVMNGVQMSPQQAGEVAYHYKLLTYKMNVSIIPYMVQERRLSDGTRVRLVSSYGTDMVYVWPVGGGSDSFSMGSLFVVRAIRHEYDGDPGVRGWYKDSPVTQENQDGTVTDDTDPDNPKLINGAVLLKIRTDKQGKKKPVVVHRGGVYGLGMGEFRWSSHIHYGTGVTLIGKYVFIGPHLCAEIPGWGMFQFGVNSWNVAPIRAVARTGSAALYVATDVGVLKWELPTQPDGSLHKIKDKDFIKYKEDAKPLPQVEVNADYILEFKVIEPATAIVEGVQFGADGRFIAWHEHRAATPGVEFGDQNLISGVISIDPLSGDYFLDKKTVTSLRRDDSSSSSESPISLTEKKRTDGSVYYVVGKQTTEDTYTSERYRTQETESHPEAPYTVIPSPYVADYRAWVTAYAPVGFADAPAPPYVSTPGPMDTYVATYEHDWIVTLSASSYSASASAASYTTDRWAAIKGTGEVLSGSVSSTMASNSDASETLSFTGGPRWVGWEGMYHGTGGSYAADARWGYTTTGTGTTTIAGVPLTSTVAQTMRHKKKIDTAIGGDSLKAEYALIGFFSGGSETINTVWESVDRSTDPITTTQHPQTLTLSTEQYKYSLTQEVELQIGGFMAVGNPQTDETTKSTNIVNEYLCYLNLDTGWAVTQRFEHSSNSYNTTETIITNAIKIRKDGTSTYEVHRASIYGEIDGGVGLGVQTLHDKLFEKYQTGSAEGSLGFLHGAVSTNECLMFSFEQEFIKGGEYDYYGRFQGGDPRAWAVAVCDDGTVTDLYDVVKVPAYPVSPPLPNGRYSTTFEMALLREKI